MRRMFSEKQIKSMAGATAQALIEGGEIDNAKPIYCHPISMAYDQPTHKIRIACLIFNNDPTTFTLTSFKEYIDDLYTSVGASIRIIATGGYFANEQYLTMSWIYKSATDYGIAGMATDGTLVTIANNIFDSILPNALIFNDGVNKIN